MQQPLVLHCDNHLLALQKPAGMATQPSNEHEYALENWGKEWIRQRYNKPGNVFLEAIHRLDLPTSGIVLFARTSKALKRMMEAIRNKKTEKNYLAEVEGEVIEDGQTLTHHLERSQNRMQAFASSAPQRKKSSLTYRILKRKGTSTLLDIQLHTGRHHQIRCQLATIGHPILGDRKYGAKSHLQPQEIHLHHQKLIIPHPIGSTPLLLETAPPLWGV